MSRFAMGAADRQFFPEFQVALGFI